MAYSPDGKPQAGMGVSIGDYNRDGLLDIVKTNFAGDTDSLFMNLGDGSFDDRTYQAGLGINTRLLGWGVSFIDIDNDGWLDILVANGHVYPEVDGTQVDAAYAERKYLYRNLRNGQFEDVSLIGGSGITTAAKARGFAVGDYDNDGDLDAVVNCVNAVPQLLRCDSTLNRSWVKIRLVGTKSNRTGIGARIKVVAQTGSPVLNAKAGTPAHADRGSAVVQRLFLRQRSAHSLRIERCEESGSCRDSMALGYGGYAEGSGCESAVRDRRGREDLEERSADGGQKKELRQLHTIYRAPGASSWVPIPLTSRR